MAGERQTLMAELLFEAPPEVDAESLAERVRETLPKTVAVPGKHPLLAHGDYPQRFEDGTRPILTAVMRPDEGAGAGPYDLTQSWAFEGKEEAAERATTTLLVAEMLGRGAPAADRVSAFKATLAAVVEQTRPLAIWSAGGAELVSPDRVGEHPLACLVNVRLFRVEEDEDVCVMDTLGLDALGLPDFQLHFRELDPSELAGHLRNLAAYAFEHGQEIASGHTISGPDGEGKWKLQLEDALVAPERPVLDIDPGPPYAAGNRA
jgi:uncharacterized protein DUF4261